MSLVSTLKNFSHNVESRRKIIASAIIISLTFVITVGFGLRLVNAAGSISPDGGQYDKDLPIFVSIKGLTADTYYTVYTVQDGTATLILNMTSSSSGELMVSVTFTETGEGRLEVRVAAGTTVTVSANYLIVDTFNDMLLPVLIWVAILSIGVGLVFMVIRTVGGKF